LVNDRCPQVDEENLIYPEDRVVLDGHPLPSEKAHLTYLFHKPKSVTTSARDPDGKQDLSRWLKKLPPGLFPVGRLDRETTGALLFTSDGDLATALLRPEHKTEKLYWLWLNESLAVDDTRLTPWLTGIPVGPHRATAKRVEVMRTTPDFTELHVVLVEGKNRQIRRMARASDFRLLHLHRKAVGPIELGSLGPGETRQLGPSEVDELWTAAGGRTRVLEKQLFALRRRAQAMREAGTTDLRLERFLESTVHIQ